VPVKLRRRIATALDEFGAVAGRALRALADRLDPPPEVPDLVASKARHPSITGTVRHLSISPAPPEEAEAFLARVLRYPVGPHSYTDCGGRCPAHSREVGR
jgi:hypothetical protein